jgi:hypothetical protein
MTSFSHSGDFNATEKFLKKIQKMDIDKILESQGSKGVRALASATPKDSSRAATSWDYEVQKTASTTTIFWTNKDVENGYPVAVMIQHGHGTGTGGYVHGIDYINPAMRPVFEDIAQAVWKAVTSA